MNEIKEGAYVHYISPNGKKENGIVKSMDTQNAFVVYHWDDDPKEYRQYTGAQTSLEYLRYGWVDGNGDILPEYCDHHYISSAGKWQPINRRTCIYCGHTID